MKRKGFTLIELLAVILILGIIALIAIPTVNKIIKESQKGAFESSVNNIIGAIEEACQLQVLKGESITTTYTFTNGLVSPSLNIKGKLPNSGTAIVDAKCNVILSATNGKFIANKITPTDITTITEGTTAQPTHTVFANGTAVYFNPVTGNTCTAGQAISTTGTKTGCMKWYAFNDGGAFSDTINLILDHNTTVKVPWNSINSNISGPTTVLTQLQADTSTWAGVPTITDSYSVSNGIANYTINYDTYKARLITAGEIATITGNTNFGEATTPYTSWFYLDSNTQTKTAMIQGASKYAWLFDYTISCASNGCNKTDAIVWGYWTSTASAGNSNFAWSVSMNGNMCDDYAVNININGIRPVITLQKSSL